MRLCQRTVGLTLLGLLAYAATPFVVETCTRAEAPARPTQFTQGTVEPPLAPAPLVQPPLPTPPPPPPPADLIVPQETIAPVPALPPPGEPPIPVVAIRVRVVACAAAGQEIEYCICVANTSPAAAHHVLVRDPLPANARFVRANPAPTKIESELQWYLGTLPGLCSKEIVLVLQPTNEEDVKNCARVQFEYGQCVCTRIARSVPLVPVIPSTPAPTPAPTPIPGAPPVPQEKVKPTPAGQAKLQLTASGTKEELVNQPTTYTLTLTNIGSAAASKAIIEASLPPQTTFVSASGGGTELAGLVAWPVGTLETGASRKVEVTLKAQAVGQRCVKARARADDNLSAEAEACTIFKGAVGLGVRVETTRNPMAVGEDTSYVITVENHGSLPASNIQVRAVVPSALALVSVRADVANKLGQAGKEGQGVDFNPMPQLAPGAKATFTVFVRAMSAGEARFRATITADQLPTGPVIDEQNTTIFADAGGP